MKNNRKKVIVSMSGGVDSAVSAWLLKEQGYLVEGLFMKNWEEDDNEGYCASSSDLTDVRNVCYKLGILLHTKNFSLEYWDTVFEHFLTEHKAGRTPNPDILCNKEIKFKVFLNFAIEDLGAHYIATGHYVRSIIVDNKNQLFCGIDKSKDQSYFLYTLSHMQIAKCLFPVGNLTKQEVRQIAINIQLDIALKKSSIGICFIGKKKFRDFIGKFLSIQPGKIISVDGRELGYHKGLFFFTLGQRKGLGIGGINIGNKKPWYVVEKDVFNNLLIVAQGQQHPKLMSSSFIVNELHWVNREPIINLLYCGVKVRYQQPIVSCLIKPKDNESLQVILDKPVYAITPGQSAVFYIGDRCFGGGIIKNITIIE